MSWQRSLPLAPSSVNCPDKRGNAGHVRTTVNKTGIVLNTLGFSSCWLNYGIQFMITKAVVIVFIFRSIPWHPPSLIRVFIVRMKKAWVLSYPLSAQQRLWSDWADGCPGWSESSLGAQSFCWFCHEAAHISSVWLNPKRQNRRKCRKSMSYKYLLWMKRLRKNGWMAWRF